MIEKDRTENMAEKLSRLTAEESQILMKLLETGKTAEQGCSFFAENGGIKCIGQDSHSGEEGKKENLPIILLERKRRR